MFMNLLTSSFDAIVCHQATFDAIVHCQADLEFSNADYYNFRPWYNFGLTAAICARTGRRDWTTNRRRTMKCKGANNGEK